MHWECRVAQTNKKALDRERFERKFRIEKKYKQRLKSHDINLLEMKMEHDFRGRVAKIEVNQPIQDRSQHDCIEE